MTAAETLPETARPVLVWAEIPVTDLEKAMEFYAKVFDYKMTVDTNGPNPISFLNNDMNGTGGHLYPGTPAKEGQGPTVHLQIPDTLEEATVRVTEAGGTLIGGPVPLPVGRFHYAQDLDGNSIGLFEVTA